MLTLNDFQESRVFRLRYNCNIVECGIKQHNPKHTPFLTWMNICTFMIINVDVVSGRDKRIMDVVSMKEDTCLDMADFE